MDCIPGACRRLHRRNRPSQGCADNVLVAAEAGSRVERSFVRATPTGFTRSGAHRGQRSVRPAKDSRHADRRRDGSPSCAERGSARDTGRGGALDSDGFDAVRPCRETAVIRARTGLCGCARGRGQSVDVDHHPRGRDPKRRVATHAVRQRPVHGGSRGSVLPADCPNHNEDARGRHQLAADARVAACRRLCTDQPRTRRGPTTQGMVG